MPISKIYLSRRGQLARSALICAAMAGPMALGGCAGALPVGPVASAEIPSAPAPGPAPAGPIATVQPGDAQLDCSGLSAQIGEMDQIASERVDTGVSAINFVPIIGDVVGLANINAHANRLQDEANRKNQAYQRKQYLLQLYTSRRC